MTNTTINTTAANAEAVNVLVATDQTQPAQLILKTLAGAGIRGCLAREAKITERLLQTVTFAMAFIACDPGSSSSKDSPEQALKLVKLIKAGFPEMPVVMFATAKTDQANLSAQIKLATKALRTGCTEFIPAPLTEQSIRKNLGNLALSASLANPAQVIVGTSSKLRHCIEMAKKVAPTAAPVLVTGQSGTGKELICQLIHQNSKRAHGPFVRLNCAALSESLLESELFGHEKGAFTGADTQRKGRFEMAHGGTLMLDEITETPLQFQAKLLRVLEQQDFERVGGNEQVRVNVRIISTTNKNLPEQIRKGKFREDLYYRLSAVRIQTPALRSRKEDLPDLIWHFVSIYAAQANRKIKQLDRHMLSVFEKYSWPGNIRQLRNVVLSCLIMGSGPTLSLEQVSWLFEESAETQTQNTDQQLQSGPRFVDLDSETSTTDAEFSNLAGVSLHELERMAIIDTLRHTDGNRTRAAEVLGISDRTLRGKIKKYKQQGIAQLT